MDFVDSVDFIFGAVFWGVINVLGMFIFLIFLGDGFSNSWQNFLLGVLIFSRGGGVFFWIFG